ncbi:MAG: malonyl-CoA synthase [Gammaproteobacteria bacterium]|nr:malonyl-CoA synthase [Gammaproteobacteria bacterium]
MSADTANQNLYEIFRRRMPSDDRVFLDAPGQKPVYYRELDGMVARLQQRLEALGVRPGERVVAQVAKSPTAVLLYLACLRSGAIYIPLNTAYTAAEVEYFLSDSRPVLLVCQPRDEAQLGAVATGCGVAAVATLDGESGGSLGDGEAGASPPVAHRGAEQLAAILYTSGTTGRAKGAMLSHANLASNALVLYDYWQWRTDDVLLHALPIFHVHGLFVALHCALLGGSRVHLLPRFDVGQVLSLLPESSVMMGVPTFYTRLLENPDLNADACRNMRLFISGSAPLLPETHVQFTERTGHRILERYGMTEAGMISSNPYDGERIAGTVGFPLPGVEARVVDGHGDPLPVGEAGILEIRGPNVFRGYWEMPEKTAAEFRDGWFITGDVVSRDAEGRLSIVGREKDLIISGGFNVYPREIEMEIDALEGVRESAVIGLPHADFGEGVTAVVVPENPAVTDAEGILAALGDRLARFKQPKRIVFVDSLPRNSMGKVQKNVLRERYRELFA